VARPPAQSVAADLDRDGRRERVVLDPDRDPSLSVWRGNRRLWQGIPRRWRPWKLQAADVDGDGRPEVVVGVHKSTRFFPRPHNCLFVYSFERGALRAKWLGSSLSKPFTDFTFAGLDSDAADELVAVETTGDGRYCVVIYSWNGFGFIADRQRGRWKSARLLPTRAGRAVVLADGARVRVTR
jgi:hypothetical protein